MLSCVFGIFVSYLVFFGGVGVCSLCDLWLMVFVCVYFVSLFVYPIGLHFVCVVCMFCFVFCVLLVFSFCSPLFYFFVYIYGVCVIGSLCFSALCCVCGCFSRVYLGGAYVLVWICLCSFGFRFFLFACLCNFSIPRLCV